MKNELILFVTICTIASCDFSSNSNSLKDWKSILKEMYFIVDILQDPVSPDIAIKQLSAFELFRIDSLEKCVIGNGQPLYFKKEAFQHFLDKYNSNIDFNKVVVKFTQINASSAPNNLYYGKNNGKLHYFFYAAHLHSNDSLSLIDSIAYEISDQATSTSDTMAVEKRVEYGFLNAYLTGCNIQKLNNLMPAYNSNVYPNTRFIQIDKVKFKNFIDTTYQYSFVEIDFSLSNDTGTAPFDHKNFLNLLFFRTDSHKNIIKELGIYDINDKCPPFCPSKY